MTKADAAKVLAMLRAAYPQHYRNANENDAEAAISLWAEMFSDFTVDAVGAAVMAFIAGDTKGFHPAIGQIRKLLTDHPAEQEMSETEAAAMVLRATENSIYHCNEEFDKLPPILQKVVGNPAMLREWAQLDRSEVQTVVSSNIQRSFRAMKVREREDRMLPQQVKDALYGTVRDKLADKDSYNHGVFAVLSAGTAEKV